MLRGALLVLALLLCPAPAHAAPEWTVSATQSTLAFSATQMGKPFEGAIAGFTAAVRFDPADLAASHVAVTIDLATLSTGDRDRDRTAAATDWLDLSAFPKARFESTAFRKTGDTFEADGTLELKGHKAPVTLTFDFVPYDGGEQHKATVTGKAVLNRAAFALGTGEWADPGVVGSEIAVRFVLVAYRPKK
jgi:polyisoprenoid-binding protein YceI